MDRRRFLQTSGFSGLAATAGISGFALSQPTPTPNKLFIQEAHFDLGRGVTTEMISLSDNAPPPVLRMRQGEEVAFDITNTTEDYTAMHWHGLRIANTMDGVPYLTQFPFGKDQTFSYRFTPPDAGTYWYHPHCMTMRQMARGLTGALIVEERRPAEFDADLALNLRDFRLNEDGTFLPAFSARGAARSGTHGNTITTNWRDNPQYAMPSGGLVRLRVLNTDTTRIHRVFFRGAAGRVIAWDGHPILNPVPMPTEALPLRIGPGQRFDVALLVPTQEGSEIILWSDVPGPPRPMASLVAEGAPLNRDLRDTPILPQNPVSTPNLNKAERLEFVFGWTSDGAASNNGFCGSFNYAFWAINRTPWPGNAAENTGPLAELKLGKSYVLRLINESPNAHPIHLHGLTFLPIASNKRVRPRNWTDTVLLEKSETIDIAFVADNPGDWAFHCHVIEHQKTGLAGYLRIIE